MMKFLSKFFYGLFIFLLIRVTTLFLVPMLPIQDNIAIKIVKSGSMEPAIRTGSIVVIKPDTQYKIGDVITFGEDTKTSYPTTHRVVAISDLGGETFYQVKGDANEEADPTLTKRGDVIGKVIFSVPAAGYVLDFARQPVGFMLLIAFPAALVILNEIVDIMKEIRRVMRRRKEDDPPSNSKVLKRLYRMDDVFRPMYLAYPISTKRRKKAPVVVSIMTLFVLGSMLTQSGDTASYFADTEKSLGNTLSAGSFSISASALPTESYVGHSGGSTVISTVTPNPVGLPNEYTVKVEQMAGSSAFCQALIMSSSDTPPFNYTGPLLAFAPAPTTYSGGWSFEVNLSPDAVGINADDICAINLVYTAKTWIPDKGVHGGYSDVEKVTLIFEASEYDVEEVQDTETPSFNLLSAPLVDTSLVEQEDATSTTSTTEEAIVETQIIETQDEATSTPPVVEETPVVTEDPPVVEEVPPSIVEEETPAPENLVIEE